MTRLACVVTVGLGQQSVGLACLLTEERLAFKLLFARKAACSCRTAELLRAPERA